MKTVEYKAPEGFTGTAKLRVPKFTERLKYIKECNFQVGADGEVNSSMDQIGSIISLVECTKDHIVEVNLTHTESGVVAKSYEDLEDSPEFDSVIPEIASAVLNGGKVGKS